MLWRFLSAGISNLAFFFRMPSPLRMRVELGPTGLPGRRRLAVARDEFASDDAGAPIHSWPASSGDGGNETVVVDEADGKVVDVRLI